MDAPPHIDWRPHGQKAHAAAKRAVLVYLVLALAWILLSDGLVAQLAGDTREMQRLQTLKGWGFVIVTAAMFYLLVYRRVLLALRSEAVERLLSYDAVTGLPNAAMLATGMHQALGQAQRTEHSLWVFAIQVHEYQRVLDSLGNAAGGEVLLQAADRITNVLRAGELLARYEGAIFLAVVPERRDAEGRAGVIEALRRTFCTPVLVAGQSCHVGVRIGVSEFPQDGVQPDELVGHAIAAMHRAVRENGVDAFDYTASFRQEALESYRLESDLHLALARDEFRLLYQPQTLLADGRCCAVEALLRWRHPEMGEIPPGRFIPLAEDSELILAIGEWVLRAACSDAVAWQGTEAEHLRVAVNLSTRQFNDPQLPCRIEAALRETGLPANRLEIEITETAAMQDPQAAIAIVRRLQTLGVRVAIDDFGTGYSSLAYLRDFAVDRLKIDRSLVSGIPGNSANLEICRAILGLCRNLGITCLAEGIERPEELASLRQHGCAEGQGYLFAKPMTAARLQQWILERTSPDRPCTGMTQARSSR